MKQKITIKVRVHCEACRSVAMRLASLEGVESVNIQGPDRDRLVLVGDGVDSVCLTKKLRKKLGYAVILTIEEVRPQRQGQEQEQRQGQGQRQSGGGSTPMIILPPAPVGPVIYNLGDDTYPTCYIL